MKNKILVLCLLLLIGCKSKPVPVEPVVVEYTKVPPSEVDANQKKKAYDLGKRVLMICNTSKFDILNVYGKYLIFIPAIYSLTIKYFCNKIKIIF